MNTRHKKTWVFLMPPVFCLGAIGVVFLTNVRPRVAVGIAVGLVIALVQTAISIGLMKWAWTRKSFYTIWGSGVLFRFVVFAVTAFVVYRFTNLNLAATLLSLVTSTTLFLVFESAVFLKSS